MGNFHVQVYELVNLHVSPLCSRNECPLNGRPPIFCVFLYCNIDSTTLFPEGHSVSGIYPVVVSIDFPVSLLCRLESKD